MTTASACSKFGRLSRKAAGLGGAARGVVLRIEIEHDRLALELRQRDLAAPSVGSAKSGALSPASRSLCFLPPPDLTDLDGSPHGAAVSIMAAGSAPRSQTTAAGGGQAPPAMPSAAARLVQAAPDGMPQRTALQIAPPSVKRRDAAGDRLHRRGCMPAAAEPASVRSVLGDQQIRSAWRHGAAAGTGRGTRSRPGRRARCLRFHGGRSQCCWTMRARMAGDIARQLLRVALLDQVRRGRMLATLAAKPGSPATTRARVSAICSQVRARFRW